jgi:dynein intermediate chain 2
MNKEGHLGYAPAAQYLTQAASNTIKANNQINMFEEYFEGEKPEIMSDAISTQTIMIFKDPNSHGAVRRAVTKINWHPDANEGKVAVAYARLKFQPKDGGLMPKQAYIWNLNNPNTPELTLEPTSPLCTLTYNPKIPESIVGGCYDGSLNFFDTRMGSSGGTLRPTMMTKLENSHHDPVYDVAWLTAGKAGKECVSTSTDGQILWWDMKREEKPAEYKGIQIIDRPVEKHDLFLDVGNAETGKSMKLMGGTSMEYNVDAGPTKYLVGTEQGYTMLVSKRKQIETSQKFGLGQGKHHGPVYALQRNPQINKYFMSVGDWQAKIWCEEGVFNPIMQTRYHQAYLTDGCWSPTRPGLFFLTRMDGFLDVWDFFYRQNEIAYSQKVSDAPLTSIRIQGSIAAIGDSDGTVSLLHLCKALTEPAPREKEIMTDILDREFRREKNLETAKRNQEKKGAGLVDDAKERKKKEEIQVRLQDRIKNIESTFFE